jgi:DNA-3-methyladenine glycosylase I
MVARKPRAVAAVVGVARRALAAAPAVPAARTRVSRRGEAAAAGLDSASTTSSREAPRARAPVRVKAPAGAAQRHGAVLGGDGRARCWWCVGPPEYEQYHDSEWSREVRGDRELFELLCLEGAQAGLSWLTVLRKRDNYRRVFHGFDVARCAALSDAELAQALAEPDASRAVVRHAGKVKSVRDNARAALAVQREVGPLSAWLWSFAPAQRSAPPGASPRSTSPEADALSQALRARGFSFCGPTIVYAFMQACGMVDDHCEGCFLNASAK